MARKDALLLTVGLLGAVALQGCGPTQAGIEAREDARDRLDMFNAQVSYEQAMQSYEVGRFDRALRNVEGAISVYPEMSEYHLLQGRIYLEMHRLEDALKAFNTALEKNPDDPEAHYYSGIVFQRWSDDEQAYEEYQAAFEADPTNVQYLLASAESMIALGEFDVAHDMLVEKLEYFEHNSAMQHLLGQIALLQGDLAEAETRYTEARLLSPDDVQLLEELARVQFRNGSYQSCFESVRELVRSVEEPRVDLSLLEARCLALLGRNTEARTVYTELSQVNPDNVEVWVELGTIAWELGDFHRVAQCSARITTLASDRYEGYMLRGIYERHNKNLESAVQAFRQATSYSADATLPHILLGISLEEFGQYDSAQLAYRDALRIDPASREATVLLQRLDEGARISSVPEAAENEQP
ncbi:MAG: tetratricopeptide repeat protein [Planctomycetota bacterium]|jgi:tetratricopeptide (TPR) repeat protein